MCKMEEVIHENCQEHVFACFRIVVVRLRCREGRVEK